MICVRCGRSMIWTNDFDSEDVGCEVPGIVTYYSCECGVQAEVLVPFDRDDLIESAP